MIKIEDRVRVTYEGTVTRVATSSETLNACACRITTDDGNNFELNLNPATDVKVIEPDFVDGGIYIDADGDIFRYTATGRNGGPGWHEFDTNVQRYGDSAEAIGWPTRPLTRLDG